MSSTEDEGGRKTKRRKVDITIAPLLASASSRTAASTLSLSGRDDRSPGAVSTSSGTTSSSTGAGSGSGGAPGSSSVSTAGTALKSPFPGSVATPPASRDRHNPLLTSDGAPVVVTSTFQSIFSPTSTSVPISPSGTPTEAHQDHYFVPPPAIPHHHSPVPHHTPPIHFSDDMSNSSASSSTSGTTTRTMPAPSSQGTSYSLPLASPTSSLSTLISHAPRPRLTRTDSSAMARGGTLHIEGYRDVRIIGTPYDDAVACRAVSINRGDQRVLLKLSLSASVLVAAHIRAEIAVLTELWEAGIHNCTRVIAREVSRLGTIMVCVDDGLTRFSERYEMAPQPRRKPYWSDPADLLDAIDIAIKLIRLAASVHGRQIVHGSLRPDCVSISVLGEVQMHDFSCSFRASAEGDTNPIRERGLHEDSLPYIAPECSGRVGRSADYRSDYYSIGAILYEVFAGRAPFADAIDPLDVVHAHITRKPSLMTSLDPSIPMNLSLVIAKLLEKSQDARYQTSEGIVVDLSEISRQVRKQTTTPDLALLLSPMTGEKDPATPGEISSNGSGSGEFVVGDVDTAAHFRLPPSNKMYGRDESIEQVTRMYRHVKETGEHRFVVVKGPSGVGKTTLVESVRRPAIQAKGFYTSVKFDQYKSPVPFFAIVQSLSGLLRQVLAEPEASLLRWRKRIHAALGKDGRALADLLPALELIFEPGWVETLPPLVPLGAAESEQRFQSLVRSVLRTFARPGRPLVIVFDDLQWCTLSDLAFIRSLLPEENDTSSRSSSHQTPKMLIALWRDNEVDSEHIVSTQLLAQVPEVHLTLSLEPLSLTDVIDYVGAALQTPATKKRSKSTAAREDPNIRTLSELILATTKGSPLFVAQLLKSFNTDGFFKFDFDNGKWIYDLHLIANKTVTTDVVDLLIAQMRRLPEPTRYALMVAACLGNEELKSTTLAKATGRSLAELSVDLHDATEEGLLFPVGMISPDADVAAADRPAAHASASDEVDSSQEKEAEGRAQMHLGSLRARKGPSVPQAYRFFHDRCQQAAYALVTADERSQLHHKIGLRLVASLTEDQLQEQIFDLANQLNFGIDLLTTDEARDRLARFNFLAGQKAQNSTAFEAARKYLQTAWDLLGADGWTRQYQLMSDLVEAFIDVEYSLTDYAASQQFIRLFLSNSSDVVAKLRVYARFVRCGSAMGDSSTAIKAAREGLAQVNMRLPETGSEADALFDEIHDQLKLGVEEVRALSNLEQMTDPIALGVQNLLGALIPPVYFSQIELLGGLTSLALRNTVQHGLSDAGSLFLTLDAVYVRAKYDDLGSALAYGDVAIGYFEKYGGTAYACPTYKVVSSHITAWARPIAETIPNYRTAIAYGLEYRDAEYVGFSCAEICSYLLLSGAPLPGIMSSVEGYAVLVRKFRHELSTLYIGVIHQTLLCLSGRSPNPLEIEGEAFSHADYQICADRPYGTDLHTFHMLRLMILVFFDRTTSPAALESIRIGREFISSADGLLYPTYFQLFEALCFYDRFDELTKVELDTLAATVAHFAKVSVDSAMNFLPLKLWLDAEAARAKSQREEALSAYDLAIALASDSGFVHIAACMNERCAKMLQSPKLSAGYIIEAHAMWSTWGCTPKTSSMLSEHPLLNHPTASPMPSPGLAYTGSVASPAATADSSDRRTSAYTSVTHSGEDLAMSVTHSEGFESVNGSTSRDERSTAIAMTASKSILRRRRSIDSQDSISSREEAEHSSEGLKGKSQFEHRSLIATELDLRTVVSASSVLSQELTVDGVVSKLLSLALRTAGAEMGLLVLDKGGSLCAEAIVRSELGDVQHLRRLEPIDAQPDRFPCSVINYVARTKAMVVNGLDSLGDSITDPYLKANKPLSLLCIALASQSRVTGVLYMENSQTDSAFTPDRLEILSLISGQAASTIERARLVQDLKLANTDLKRSQAALEGYNRNLEETVEDRTLELRHKNDLLQAEIAQKERAQAEMRKAKEIAESATAMKSQFLANMSHELRTPFNAVVSLTTLLLDTTLTPVQTDYVETIKNSSQELLVVINDILDYSKIELDHLELSSEPVQLRSVLESSMDMLAERAATKSVELALVIEETDIRILSDLTRLRQIVVNLLSNAVKFTSEGEIIVTASSRRVETKGPGGKPMCRVTISVQDTGIGIAKEHYNKLFRVFSQVEGSETTKHFGGTGLGLAISRKLSLLMGGDVTVDSEVGKGSTFTVHIVAPVLETTEIDLYSPSQNPDLVGKRCLVVDANATSRNVLHQLVSSFGINTDVPDDPMSAFALASDALRVGKPYDVLILDAFLPAFGALILLRRLRQANINVPAIALTRMGSPIYEEMRQLDCKFLIKPIKRNRFHHTLRQIFPIGAIKLTSPPPASSPFPTGLGVRNPLSILCAEDNPINVKVITHLLKRMAYTTDIAEDGAIALEKVQKKKYDIVFMDVNMPNMDGLEATRRIIELMPNPATRPMIVCLTANAMSDDREKCLAAGGDGYVSKPILVPDLVAALNDASARVNRRRLSLVGTSGPSDDASSGSNSPFPVVNPFDTAAAAERVGRLSGALALPTTRQSLSPAHSPRSIMSRRNQSRKDREEQAGDSSLSDSSPSPPVPHYRLSPSPSPS
ncbi:BZ3500_MvSof-1268-A1-R1_Chr3-1g05452 [Microbotryum saponariae]|uniref:histidine kinase n=1 Tax=Microbotryum saponariae TaxID=289078 RepID=A0A2X0LHX0_9BASI|nr:BZ3500_MvSof-1268-A1-R1_Chr3-1g05452 [Microbotryum saponariae]SDA04643.1 BZ3501_MvSof-1269-A2-R1_Chr3-1g05123 [Microbotryum saponariae]